MQTYPSELKEKLIRQVLEGTRTVNELASEHSISRGAIYRWLRNTANFRRSSEKNYSTKLTMKLNIPKGWTVKQAIEAAVFCQGKKFNSPEVGEYCRRKGLLSDQLRKICEWYAETDFVPLDALNQSEKEKSNFKKENAVLKGELKRKDSALAETAALLVLSKKARAIWGENTE